MYFDFRPKVALMGQMDHMGLISLLFWAQVTIGSSSIDHKECDDVIDLN